MPPDTASFAPQVVCRGGGSDILALNIFWWNFRLLQKVRAAALNFLSITSFTRAPVDSSTP